MAHVARGLIAAHRGKRVAQRHPLVECGKGAELIASHALVFKQRKTVFLPGQYQGLDPKTARRIPPGRAREKEVAVEARSLAVYEERAHD